MPELLQNVATRNAYADALTLGPVKNCKQLNFLGVGQPFFVTLWKPDPNDPNGFPVEEGTEREYPANGSDVFQNVAGAKFRSKIAGQPANVYASLSYATDPLSLGAGVTSAIINSSGQIVTPGNAVIVGNVSSGGTIISGSGYTVVRNGTGAYTVTFTPALTVPPVVVPAVAGGSGAGISYPVLPTINGFTIQVFVTNTLAPFDLDWGFAVFTP